jgi:phosphoribosylglycinamide formyltransferase 1
MIKLAIFASGTGTNAAKIIQYFADSETVEVNLIVTNKADAGVLAIAAQHTIDSIVIQQTHFFEGDEYLHILQKRGIDFIVLAGFLWKIPENFIIAYPNKIVNIHPALLPKFGGKGMYGLRVHEAVFAAGEQESGITIHFVNEKYDEGAIVYQAKCAVAVDDTPALLAQKIHELEHAYYPMVIEGLLEKE